MPTVPVPPYVSDAERMYRDSLGGPVNMSLSPDYAELTRRISSSTGPVMQRPPLHAVADERTRKMWISMRLRLPEGQRWPFDFLETHYAGEKVLVFAVIGDNHVVLEDAAELFPSDTLITQLRLIAK